MEEWLPLIKDLGFPVVVTLYLLHRIEAKLDVLNNSITNLPEKLTEKWYPSTIERQAK